MARIDGSNCSNCKSSQRRRYSGFTLYLFCSCAHMSFIVFWVLVFVASEGLVIDSYLKGIEGHGERFCIPQLEEYDLAVWASYRRSYRKRLESMTLHKTQINFTYIKKTCVWKGVIYQAIKFDRCGLNKKFEVIDH